LIWTAGRVRARALIGPDRKIVFTEITDPRARQFILVNVTLRIFDPKKMNRVPPHIEAGGAVFAWVAPPPMVWQAAAIQP